MSKQSFYSHGKLLLTSEYLVLDGVKALALPTKKGQWLSLQENNTNTIIWKSFDIHGDCWFEAKIYLPLSEVDTVSDDKITKTLLGILKTANTLNPNFLSSSIGYTIETRLEFDRLWGLGSSSTLINNIAQWADVNAFELLKKSFGGSGYDIASAQNDTPIYYTKSKKNPIIEKADFNPSFKDQIFFVYLNQKQDSKASIQHYQSLSLRDFDKAAADIERIANQMVDCSSIETFNTLIDKHEEVISRIIKTPTVKSRLFSEYIGSIKSLGGWGGDFVLATGTSSDMDYFRNQGYQTILAYSEMVL